MLKKQFIIIGILLVFFNLFANDYEGSIYNLEFYPKTSIIEIGAIADCDLSAQLFDLIEGIKSDYNYSELVTIRYYSQEGSGEFSSPYSNDFFDFYNLPDLPLAVINGSLVLDNPENVMDENLIRDLIKDAYFSPSPVRINTEYSLDNPEEISVEVTMFCTREALEEVTLKLVLIEDDISDLHSNVVRYVIAEEFSLSGQGNSVNFNFDLDLSLGWNIDNIKAIVFIQDDYNIIQTDSSYLKPDHITRVVVPFDREITGPESGVYDTEYLSVINLGNLKNYTIHAEFVDAPDGWMVTFCDGAGCYINPMEFILENESYKQFAANIMPNSPGMGVFNFVLTSGSDFELLVPFAYHAGTSIYDSLYDPQELVLFQNYPNPFYIKNDLRTIISFDSQRIPNASKIEIFNIKGQLIRLIDIENGKNYITWDGKDNYGNFISTGVYFYRIDSDLNSRMKRMIVVK